MTHEHFNKLVEEQLERIRKVLIKKQEEYNLNDDRLSHFKEAAGAVSWTPEKVLLGYMLKHWKSIVDQINSGKKFSKERWQEKITDLMNYNCLLLGLLEDDNMFLEEKKPAKKAVKVRLVEDATNGKNSKREN